MSKVEDRLQASNGIWDVKWDAFEMDIVSRETNKAISELKRLRSVLVEKDREIEELSRRLSKKILHLCVCEDIDWKDKEIAELKEIVEFSGVRRASAGLKGDFMPTIFFSHMYPKLLDSHNDVVESAKLLGLFRVKLEDLHSSFLSYDTDNGKCHLPKTGEYLMLLFLKPHESYVTDQNLFTTLRRYTPQKYEYYQKKVGLDFDIVIKH